MSPRRATDFSVGLRRGLAGVTVSALNRPDSIFHVRTLNSGMTEQKLETCPQTEEALEERLSRPTPELIAVMAEFEGDIMVLGAGGKMGPSLARMARRALDSAGLRTRVMAVARFTDLAARRSLEEFGVETIPCDLYDRDKVNRLPDAPNVIYMAGQKFGTTDAPERTWAANTLLPAIAAERYAGSRIVAFSTGCVYPNASVDGPGSREDDALEPLGEYANSCVGRERILQYFSGRDNTPMVLLRLFYANDLRYGVLVDVAQAVSAGTPIDLATGYANVIWQGDANAFAIRLLAQAAVPPLAINITGPEMVSIRELAARFGELMGKVPTFVGTEAPTALLSDSSRARNLLGVPAVSLEQMIDWTAEWITRGGRTLNKPTHYEARDGRF